jgi:hypothetical protein
LSRALPSDERAQVPETSTADEERLWEAGAITEPPVNPHVARVAVLALDLPGVQQPFVLIVAVRVVPMAVGLRLSDGGKFLVAGKGANGLAFGFNWGFVSLLRAKFAHGFRHSSIYQRLLSGLADQLVHARVPFRANASNSISDSFGPENTEIIFEFLPFFSKS